MIDAAAKFGACVGVNVMCLHSTALAAVLMSHKCLFISSPAAIIGWHGGDGVGVFVLSVRVLDAYSVCVVVSCRCGSVGWGFDDPARWRPDLSLKHSLSISCCRETAEKGVSRVVSRSLGRLGGEGAVELSADLGDVI